MPCIRNNTDGNKLVIFSSIAFYCGDTKIASGAYNNMSAAKLLVVLIQILMRLVYSTDIGFHMTCNTYVSKQLPNLTSIHVFAETYMYTVLA